MVVPLGRSKLGKADSGNRGIRSERPRLAVIAIAQIQKRPALRLALLVERGAQKANSSPAVMSRTNTKVGKRKCSSGVMNTPTLSTKRYPTVPPS